MTRNEYVTLCSAACQELMLADVAALGAKGVVTVDNVQVFAYFDEATGDDIYLNVDIGDLATLPRRADIIRRALGLNLELDGRNSEALGLAKGDGRLYLRAKIPVYSDFDSGQYAERLRDYVAFAHDLRQNLLAQEGRENADLLLNELI